MLPLELEQEVGSGEWTVTLVIPQSEKVELKGGIAHCPIVQMMKKMSKTLPPVFVYNACTPTP
jgi:hypothetical protein